MSGPIPTNDTPQAAGTGVWLPAGLAHRMMHCYFGNGPRLDGSVPHQEAPATQQFEVPQQEPPQTLVPTIMRYPQMHPQGAARPKESSS